MKTFDALPHNSQRVEEFFKSWGLYPSEEETDDFNPAVIEQGINRACYQKLRHEADVNYGKRFLHFCSAQIDATDDCFYLSADTWAEVQEAWEAFSAGEEPIIDQG